MPADTGKRRARPGRPAKLLGQPRTTQINMRARPIFREKLEDAARANQRSLSDEAEARIELTFALDVLFGDPRWAEFAVLLSTVFIERVQRVIAGKE